MKSLSFLVGTVMVLASLGLVVYQISGWWAFLVVGFLTICVSVLPPLPKKEKEKDGYEKWIEVISELKADKKEVDPNFEEYLRLKSEGRLG